MAVLDDDGLRALKQVARKAVGPVLPPDRDERPGTSATVEGHARDGVVLLAATYHHKEARVGRPPDRAGSADTILAKRRRIAFRNETQAAVPIERREISGEVWVVKDGEAVDREPVERRTESALVKRSAVDGGVRPRQPVRMHDPRPVVIAKPWLPRHIGQ